MEVTSPGGLLPEIRINALRARERVHQSRNPRIVRALVDLGFMRDQGEGIPRLFAEMEGSFLPDPELESSESSFCLTLRNTPTLTAADGAFIGSLGTADLSDLEFRALLEASRHGRVDNARMREIAGLDTLGASKLLGGLRDRGLLVLHSAGASSYYDLPPPLQIPDEVPAQVAEAPVSSAGSSRQLELELPSVQAEATVSGPRADKVRERIRLACVDDWQTPAEMAEKLSIRSVENLTRRYLGPMVEAGDLERRFPQKTHPGQAYRALKSRSGRDS